MRECALYSDRRLAKRQRRSVESRTSLEEGEGARRSPSHVFMWYSGTIQVENFGERERKRFSVFFLSVPVFAIVEGFASSVHEQKMLVSPTL